REVAAQVVDIVELELQAPVTGLHGDHTGKAVAQAGLDVHQAVAAVGDAGSFHRGAEAGEGQVDADVGVQHRDGRVEIDLLGLAAVPAGHLEVAVEHLDVKANIEIDDV